jgi:DnaJ family protein C protein 13
MAFRHPHPNPLHCRWLSAQGRGLLGAADCARLALQLLLGLAHVQPPVDEGGCLLQPLPVVLRVLGSPRCLPHIAQVPVEHRWMGVGSA